MRESRKAIDILTGLLLTVAGAGLISAGMYLTIAHYAGFDPALGLLFGIAGALITALCIGESWQFVWGLMRIERLPAVASSFVEEHGYRPAVPQSGQLPHCEVSEDINEDVVLDPMSPPVVHMNCATDVHGYCKVSLSFEHISRRAYKRKREQLEKLRGVRWTGSESEDAQHKLEGIVRPSSHADKLLKRIAKIAGA